MEMKLPGPSRSSGPSPAISRVCLPGGETKGPMPLTLLGVNTDAGITRDQRRQDP